jgi:hypothetical protein
LYRPRRATFDARGVERCGVDLVAVWWEVLLHRRCKRSVIEITNRAISPSFWKTDVILVFRAIMISSARRATIPLPLAAARGAG